ncbi:MAG: hydroxymethylbilane synthase [Bacteroidota bacterium]
MDQEQKTIRIGTRGSKLALWQANYTKEQLEAAGIPAVLHIIKTKGDRIQHLSFDKIEGKGFFTKEIEDALLRGDIDMAVHSMKDLPTEAPEGLSVTAVSYRENPADWLLIRETAFAKDRPFKLKEGAIVGTSSARRKAQMLHYRPDIQLKDIRGNVPTRIQKLQQGDFDAILLAAAGLVRLDLKLDDLRVIRLNPKEFIPAPAQGVLAFQTCTHDKGTRRLLKVLHHPEVASCTNVERRVLQLAEGGCHMPLGVYCERDPSGHYHVWAAKADQWDGPLVMTRTSSSTHHQLAERILAQLQEKTANL